MLTRLSIARIDPNRPYQICSYLYVCLWIIELAWQQPEPATRPNLHPFYPLSRTGQWMGSDKGGLGVRLKALVAARRQGQCFTLAGQLVGVNTVDQYWEY